MNDDKCIKVKKESKPFDLAVKPEFIIVNLFLFVSNKLLSKVLNLF